MIYNILINKKQHTKSAKLNKNCEKLQIKTLKYYFLSVFILMIILINIWCRNGFFVSIYNITIADDRLIINSFTFAVFVFINKHRSKTS